MKRYVRNDLIGLAVTILMCIVIIAGLVFVSHLAEGAETNKCEIEFVNHCPDRTFWGIVKFKVDEKGEIVDFEGITKGDRVDVERYTMFLDPDSLYGVTYAETALFKNIPLIKIIDYFHFKTKKFCVGTKTVINLGEYLQCQQNETETF